MGLVGFEGRIRLEVDKVRSILSGSIKKTSLAKVFANCQRSTDTPLSLSLALYLYLSLSHSLLGTFFLYLARSLTQNFLEKNVLYPFKLKVESGKKCDM